MSKLLLIDDEADVLYSFQRIFDSPDIELTTASSGEEGLRIVPKLKPDLVIMDVRMGGITGLETLRPADFVGGQKEIRAFWWVSDRDRNPYTDAVHSALPALALLELARALPEHANAARCRD